MRREEKSAAQQSLWHSAKHGTVPSHLVWGVGSSMLCGRGGQFSIMKATERCRFRIQLSLESRKKILSFKTRRKNVFLGAKYITISVK